MRIIFGKWWYSTSVHMCMTISLIRGQCACTSHNTYMHTPVHAQNCQGRRLDK